VLVNGELRLGTDRRAGSQVRRYAAEVLHAAGISDGEAIATAQLVVTELVTNAQLHAAPPIVVRIRALRGGTRIEVADGTRSTPVPGMPGEEAMTGRGLAMIEGLAWR
jgi:anti-sigma regulatory factor (Ser/Thr protein kinase)